MSAACCRASRPFSILIWSAGCLLGVWLTVGVAIAAAPQPKGDGKAAAKSEQAQSGQTQSGRALAAAYLGEKLLFQASMFDVLSKAGFLEADDEGYRVTPDIQELTALFWQAAKESLVFERLKKELLDTSRPVKQRRKEAAKLIGSLRGASSPYDAPWLEGGPKPERRSRDSDSEDAQAKTIVAEDQNMRAYTAWLMRLSLLLYPKEWPAIHRTFSGESAGLLWRRRDDAKLMEALQKAYASAEMRRELDNEAEMARFINDPAAYMVYVSRKALREIYRRTERIYGSLGMPVSVVLPDEVKILDKAGRHSLQLAAGVSVPDNQALPAVQDGEQPNGLLVRKASPLGPEQYQTIREWRKARTAARSGGTMPPEPPKGEFPAGITLASGERLYTTIYDGWTSVAQRRTAISLWAKGPLDALATDGEGVVSWPGSDSDWDLRMLEDRVTPMLMLSTAPEGEVAGHLAGLSVMAGTNDRLKKTDARLESFLQQKGAATPNGAATPVSSGAKAAQSDSVPLRFTQLYDGSLFLLLALYADESELDRLFGPLATVWVKYKEGDDDTWLELKRKNPRQSVALRLGQDAALSLPDPLMVRYERVLAQSEYDELARQIKETIQRYPGSSPELEQADMKTLRLAGEQCRNLCTEFNIEADGCTMVTRIMTYVGISEAHFNEARTALGNGVTERERMDALIAWARAKRPFPK